MWINARGWKTYELGIGLSGRRLSPDVFGLINAVGKPQIENR